MCIIIDANVANEFVAQSQTSKPTYERVLNKKLKVVVGGRLKAEWGRTGFAGMYRQLMLAGSIKEYTDVEASKGIDMLDKANIRSDDPHVLGLALISGSRLLFSRDKKLHDDFKNLKLLPSPKGKVYQEAEHAHLLDEHICACS
jgi:hypothetical protein